jgi:uncharacterized protein (DUF58 family)
VPGLAFALIGVLTPLWLWLAARRTDVVRTLGQRSVVEGQPFELAWQVHTGRLGLPAAEVVDPVAGVVTAGRREVKLTIRFERRGRVPLPAPQLRLADPLGLAQIARRGSGGSQEVLVLPQTDPVAWINFGGGVSDDTPRRSADEPWGASDIDGLREYRPGTPASRIHWPALARGAGLLERRLRADAGALPVVVLDARCDGRLELLDSAVRAAASLVLELARRSGCDLLLPGDRRALRVGRDLAAWPEAHARLALVEDPGEAVAPALTPQLQGPIFYVAARSVRKLPRPRGHRVRQPFLLVVPRQLWSTADEEPRFSVAGCEGIALSAEHRGPRRDWVAA